MLATDDTRRYSVRDTRPCGDRPARALDDYPVSILDAIRHGGIGMNISVWLGRCLTQTGETGQLTMDVSCQLRVGQDQRVFVRQIAPTDRAS
jgi:hypothetical protein